MREPEPAGRRWRPAGISGFVRMATSPAAAVERDHSPAVVPRGDTPMHLRAEPASVSAPIAAPVHPARGPGARWAWAGLAIVLAAGIAAVEVARTGRVEPVYERLTFRRGTLSSARFGPAGEITFTA